MLRNEPDAGLELLIMDMTKLTVFNYLCKLIHIPGVVETYLEVVSNTISVR